MQLASPEAAIVGMCLRDERVLSRVLASGLSPAHFADETMREVFAAVLEADRGGSPYDLPAMGLRFPGKATALIDAHEAAPIAVDPEHIAEEVITNHLCRHLERELVSLCGLLKHRTPFSPFDTIQNRLAALFRESSGHSESGLIPRPAIEILNALTKDIEQRINERLKGRPSGIPTGIRILDKFISGLVPRRYYVVAARTSVGKTAFALSLALNAAKAGAPVAIFTVEMSATALMKRLVAAEAGINTEKLDTGDLTDDERDRYIAAATALSNLPIRIQDKTARDFDRVRIACEALKRRGELGLVVVDYLQQFKLGSERHATPYERVTRVSAEIQGLAENLDVPVIAVAQMNREAAKEDQPGIHQIKESGAIEQDADAILVLFKRQEMVWVAVAKNRHGRVGEFPVNVHYPTSRFSNASVNEAAYDQK